MRDFAIIRTADQWWRARHDRTSLDGTYGEVHLARRARGAAEALPALPGGIAFDRACRLYRSVPTEGQVERSFWRPDGATAHAPEKLFHTGVRGRHAAGNFNPAEAPRALEEPGALAIDADDRLFVLERAARRVLVYDLEHDRLLRRVSFAAPSATRSPFVRGEAAGAGVRATVVERPIDLACHGRDVWVLVDAPPGSLVLHRLTARGGPGRVTLATPRAARASAVAVSPEGARFILFEGGTRDAFVWSPDRPGLPPRAVEDATDLAFEGDGGLVVACARKADFVRMLPRESAWEELDPGGARGYDGRGLGETPTGPVGYWDGRSLVRVGPATTRYENRGAVSTFRLDAGEYQTTWGRLFLDACIPEGTEVRVRCETADEMPLGGPVEHREPDDWFGEAVHAPELTPPLLPAVFEKWLRLEDADDEAEDEPGEGEARWQHLHRRGAREMPWASLPPDGYVTYEAPVRASPGRYLWVILRLTGDGRRTPRVRCLRAEYPGHALLRALPALYSRDAEMASFLQRHLAPAEGMLALLADRADLRRVLLDPRSTPEDFIPWLAGFLGLALDPSWPLRRQRALIAEAACLFRLRGTVWGLTRFLELCTGSRVFLLEDFKVRGLAGALGGEGASFTSRAILGGGFRVGGAIDHPADETIGSSLPLSTEANAHRFTAVILGALTALEEAAVRRVLDAHRPAHTQYTLCVVDRGMRVGDGLHVGLTSLIGEGARFAPVVLGRVALGRATVLGRPATGARLGAARLRRDMRVG